MKLIEEELARRTHVYNLGTAAYENFLRLQLTTSAHTSFVRDLVTYTNTEVHYDEDDYDYYDKPTHYDDEAQLAFAHDDTYTTHDTHVTQAPIHITRIVHRTGHTIDTPDHTPHTPPPSDTRTVHFDVTTGAPTQAIPVYDGEDTPDNVVGSSTFSVLADERLYSML